MTVTNAVNQLKEALKEGLIEASAAKSDQILELTKAFNWLTDKLAYQSPPKLGIYFSLFYQFHWASKPETLKPFDVLLKMDPMEKDD